MKSVYINNQVNSPVNYFSRSKETRDGDVSNIFVNNFHDLPKQQAIFQNPSDATFNNRISPMITKNSYQSYPIGNHSTAEHVTETFGKKYPVFSLHHKNLFSEKATKFAWNTKENLQPSTKFGDNSVTSENSLTSYMDLQDDLELYEKVDKTVLANDTRILDHQGGSRNSMSAGIRYQPVESSDNPISTFSIFDGDYSSPFNYSDFKDTINIFHEHNYSPHTISNTNITTNDFLLINQEYVNLTNSSPPAHFTEEFWRNASWWGIVAILILLLTVLGNILVILAISWERRLQNMTNYFLMSLAATDLMVAVLVMPFAIVELTIGRFPFTSEWCLIWISLDVLFCTASIMHLCTISVDRFLSLRYPMKFGRHKTCRRVLLKLVFVWCLSLACSLPLSLMYATDSESTIVHGSCQIPTSLFQIIGSVICFYIPLVIMLLTYALTVRLLSVQKMQLMNGNGGNPAASTSFTRSPKSVRMRRFLRKTSSSMADGGEIASETALADPDLAKRLEAAATESRQIRETSHTPSPMRKSPNTNYHSPMSSRMAHLRTMKHNSHEHSEPSMELTVFPANEDQKAEKTERKTYYFRKPSICAELQSINTNDAVDINVDQSEILDRNVGERVSVSIDTEQEDSMSTVAEIKEEDENDECEISKRMQRDHSSGSSTSVKEGDSCSASNLNGTPVAVPCSCAPRFFLEGFEQGTTLLQGEGCGDCAAPRGASSDHVPLKATPSTDSGAAAWSRCSPCCGGGADDGLADLGSLESPWQEEHPRRTATAELVAKLIHRSGVPVSTIVHKMGPVSGCNSGHTTATNTNSNTPVHHRHFPHHHSSPSHHHLSVSNAIVPNSSTSQDRMRETSLPASQLLHPQGSANSPLPTSQLHPQSGANSSPSRMLWRTRSCTAALRFASSKRHGRNLKMEQKATKVLGIVFFTFVILWSPFFVINVLMAACPSCSRNIGSNVFSLVTWLGYVSSTVNPFFYTFFNKTFREAFWKIITCKMKRFTKYHK